MVDVLISRFSDPPTRVLFSKRWKKIIPKKNRPGWRGSALSVHLWYDMSRKMKKKISCYTTQRPILLVEYELRLRKPFNSPRFCDIDVLRRFTTCRNLVFHLFAHECQSWNYFLASENHEYFYIRQWEKGRKSSPNCAVLKTGNSMRIIIRPRVKSTSEISAEKGRG